MKKKGGVYLFVDIYVEAEIFCLYEYLFDFETLPWITSFWCFSSLRVAVSKKLIFSFSSILFLSLHIYSRVAETNFLFIFSILACLLMVVARNMIQQKEKMKELIWMNQDWIMSDFKWFEIDFQFSLFQDANTHRESGAI